VLPALLSLAWTGFWLDLVLAQLKVALPAVVERQELLLSAMKLAGVK
jgi:hypothetical protein